MKFTSALLASASLFVLGHCRPQDAPAVTPAPSLPAEEPPAAPVCSEGNNALMGMNNTPDKWCFCGGRGPFLHSRRPDNILLRFLHRSDRDHIADVALDGGEH